MRQSVWYCTKWDEVWIIERYDWNRYMRVAFIADKHPNGSDQEWWESITWPRPNRDGFPFDFVGYL